MRPPAASRGPSRRHAPPRDACPAVVRLQIIPVITPPRQTRRLRMVPPNNTQNATTDFKKNNAPTGRSGAGHKKARRRDRIHAEKKKNKLATGSSSGEPRRGRDHLAIM